MRDLTGRELVLCTLLSAILTLALVCCYSKAEQFIYFWDWSSHFDRYLLLGETLAISLRQGGMLVWQSIRENEYNFLAALLLQPFYRLFGSDRLGFILGISSLFALPALVLLAICIRELSKKFQQSQSGYAFLLGLLLVGLLPQFWIPTLAGYVGVLGLIPIALVLLVIARREFEAIAVVWFPIVGLLLTSCMLARRWYAFWAVAFCISFSLVALFYCLQRNKQTRPIPRCIALCGRLALLGASAGGVFLALCTPLVLRILKTSYSDIYSAYRQNDSALIHLRQAIEYFGPAPSLFVALGVLTSLLRKETRQFSSFLLLLSGILFLHFTRVQQFMVHHYLLLLPSVLLFQFFFFWELFIRSKRSWQKRALISAVGLFGILHCLVVFQPSVSAEIRDNAWVFTGFRSFPKTRTDLSEISRLLDFLESQITSTDDLIYVLSSSFELNDDIVRNACRRYKAGAELCTQILATHQVDKRDGFPDHLFLARFIVVSDPVGYSLRPEDQQLIGILAKQLLANKGLGSSFVELSEGFRLQNDVVVKVYERVLPFSKTALTQWSDELRHSYGEREDIYSFNSSCALVTDFTRGSIGGIVACEPEFLYLVPGTESETSISIETKKRFTQLSATLGFRDVEALPKVCPAQSGEVSIRIAADGRELARYAVDYRQAIEINLNIQDVSHITISVDKGAQGAECDWFVIRHLEIT